MYTGQFRYNVVEGKGKYEWPDSSTYEGDVKNGLRHGIGVFTSPGSEAVYSGEWFEGLRHGAGTIDFKSGARYEGSFQNGFKHGKGKMSYPSGNFYEGEWKFDKKDGYGTMHWATSKEKYYGDWKDN